MAEGTMAATRISKIERLVSRVNGVSQSHYDEWLKSVRSDMAENWQLRLIESDRDSDTLMRGRSS